MGLLKLRLPDTGATFEATEEQYLAPGGWKHLGWEIVTPEEDYAALEEAGELPVDLDSLTKAELVEILKAREGDGDTFDVTPSSTKAEIVEALTAAPTTAGPAETA